MALVGVFFFGGGVFFCVALNDFNYHIVIHFLIQFCKLPCFGTGKAGNKYITGLLQGLLK